MGSPEPDETRPEPPSAPERADWLVGPEEGLAAEIDRTSGEIARPTLLRPTLPAAGNEAPPPGSAPPPPGARPARTFGAVVPGMEGTSGFVHGPAMRWEPGAPSVPNLQRGAPAPPRPAPTPSREFPANDTPERSPERAAEIEGALVDAIGVQRPHEVVSPETFGEAVPALPWYFEMAHQLRTDRRLQVLAALVVAALAAAALWPRGEMPTSLSGIRKHADHYDGEQVHVSGRVGQVFPVGGGYAFYLLQGGDTLVVFTRSRTPVEREHVHVNGTMSNGMLDGQPTLALFEEAQPH